jgi:hypothetical protein
VLPLIDGHISLAYASRWRLADGAFCDSMILPFHIGRIS